VEKTDFGLAEIKSKNCLVEDIGNYVPRVGRSLKKLLGCGVSKWYTWFVGWIKYSLNTSNPISVLYKICG